MALPIKASRIGCVMRMLHHFIPRAMRHRTVRLSAFCCTYLLYKAIKQRCSVFPPKSGQFIAQKLFNV